jgi:hypothetical protein
MIGFEELFEASYEGVLLTHDIEEVEHQFNYFIGKVENPIYSSFDCYKAVVTTEANSLTPAFNVFLIKIDEGFKIVSISNNDREKYTAKGIPEFIIPVIAENLKESIFSSTNKGNKSYNGEQRVKNASKYWERLIKVDSKNTSYDNDKDVYCYSL